MTTSTRTLLSSIIRDSFYMAIDPEEAVDLVLDVLEMPSADVKLAGARAIGETLGVPNHNERARQSFSAMIAAIREGK